MSHVFIAYTNCSYQIIIKLVYYNLKKKKKKKKKGIICFDVFFFLLILLQYQIIRNVLNIKNFSMMLNHWCKYINILFLNTEIWYTLWYSEIILVLLFNKKILKNTLFYLLHSYLDDKIQIKQSFTYYHHPKILIIQLHHTQTYFGSVVMQLTFLNPNIHNLGR